MTFVSEEGALHERACEATGLSDFGDTAYLDGLRTLLKSLDEDAQLTPIGEFALRGMIIEALVARLRSEAGFAASGEGAAAAVDAPLVTIGLPRTGTTALHHLLSQDSRWQGLELWLTSAPKPRPPRNRWPDDPDFRACDDRMRALYERSPDMRAIHPMAADLVDECWHLLAQSFAHSSFEANAHVPGYSRWWANHDMRPAYHRHRRNLELIGSGAPDRQWLLKDATHLFALDAFIDVYPDARFIHTHRDPVRVIPSVCSLCWAARAPLNRGEDKASFGRSTLLLWERAILGALEVRRNQPAECFYDLGFDRFKRDPLAAIEGAYGHFGIELDPGARDTMKTFRAANPPEQHGAHRYTLEEWGLREGEIRERFAGYMRAFDIAEETAPTAA